MKVEVEKYSYILNNVERTITVYNDQTGTLEYIHPETKMRVVFNFPIRDTESVNNKLIAALSSQYLSRTIGSIKA